MIPILDLSQQYAELKTDLEKEVLKVLSSGQYILGENVKKLEKDFSNPLANFFDKASEIMKGNF